MSLLYYTGFYGATASEFGSFNGVNLANTADPRTGTVHASIGPSAVTDNQRFYRDINDEQTWTVGFAWKVPTWIGAGQIFCISGFSGIQLSIWVDANKYLQVYRGGDNSKTLLWSGAGDARFQMSSTVYKYIEFSCFISESGGSFSLRIDGQDSKRYDATGQNTQNDLYSYSKRISWGFLNQSSPPINQVVYIDDVYIKNDSGMLGNCRVQTLIPDSEGSVQNFTPSTGTTHWTLVDDNLNTSDYVSSAVIGDTELYNTPPISIPVSSIIAASVSNYMKASDAGARTVAPILRLGTTVYEGAQASLSTSWANKQAIWLTNPGTSGAWAFNDFDNIQIGVRVKT